MDVYGNLDTIMTSFDSRLWLGGRLQLAGVNQRKIVTFTGVSAQAYLETGDIEVPGTTSAITMVKPLVDNGSANVAVATRRLLNETITYGNPSTSDAENRVSIRSVGRYHRLQLSPTGSWSTAIGMDIELNGLGTR
jgi:hypothetical protein